MLSVLMKREFRRLASHRIYWFMMVFAPVFCFFFFADLLKQGLPMKLPIAVVDEDNTALSRQLYLSLEAIPQTDVILRTASFTEARKAMQKGEIYGIFHIPADFRQEVTTGRESVISFYTNETYLLPSSLAYKDMLFASCAGKWGRTAGSFVSRRGERTSITSQINACHC